MMDIKLEIERLYYLSVAYMQHFTGMWENDEVGWMLEYIELFESAQNDFISNSKKSIREYSQQPDANMNLALDTFNEYVKKLSNEWSLKCILPNHGRP